MKRKKPSPEDRRASHEEQEALIRALRARAAKIKAELEASRARRASS